MKPILTFNDKDWIGLHRYLSIKKTNPEKFTNEKYKTKCISENTEIDLFDNFISELRATQNKNKDFIREEYIHCRKYPFPALIEIPENKFIGDIIIRFIEEKENEEWYFKYLKNNNIPCYSQCIDRITNERWGIRYKCDMKDEPFVHIFRHAINICSPNVIQEQMGYLFTQYKELDKIDSKKETEKKRNEINYEFHKSLRQCDPFGSPNAEMIIWNLLQLTEVPYDIIFTIYKHFNKKKETVEIS